MKWIFPKHMALGEAASVSLIPVLLQLMPVGDEKGGTLWPGEAGPFPSPSSWAGWSGITPKCCEHSLFISRGCYLEKTVFSICMQYSFKAFLLQSLWMRARKKKSCKLWECNSFEDVAWVPCCWFTAAEMLNNDKSAPAVILISNVLPVCMATHGKICRHIWWARGDDVTWCGFREMLVWFSVTPAPLGVSFVWYI